jgi:hypothetical protein
VGRFSRICGVLKKQSANKQQKQKSGLPSVVPFVSLGCFGQSFLLPLRRPLAKKKTRAPKKEHLFFFFASFPVFTRSLPAFVGATTSARPQNFVRSSLVLQSLHLPPLVLWRLLYRQPSTSIGTPSADFNNLLHFVTLFRLPLHARIPSPRRSSSSVGLRWLSVTATPPLVHKKKLSMIETG